MTRRAITNDNLSKITEVVLCDNMVIYYTKKPGYNGRHIGIFKCETEELAIYDFEELIKECNLIEIDI